jgi:4-amino-4-deoxy-L-arabinose transferase-like glycosyltransferase
VQNVKHPVDTTAPAATSVLRWQVIVLLVVFAAIWIAHLSSTSLTAPQDNLEQLVWTRSVEWGYYKHPPLPTWLLWLFVQLFGWHAWVSYLVGAAVNLLALFVFWHFLAHLRGRRHALIALLAALCITYYNCRLYYYNHNTVLMLTVCLSAWTCWKAFETHRLTWWLALGLALGMGALSKYQIAITVLCVLVCFAQQRAWQVAAHRQGILMAGLIALAVFSPHWFWLQANDFAPLSYASETSLGRDLDGLQRSAITLLWLLDMLFNRALPAGILLVVVYLNSLNVRRIGAVKVAATPPTSPASPAARAFLLIWGILPLLFIVALGLMTGAGLQLHWGTAFLLFLVPAMMEVKPVLWSKVSLRRAAVVFVLIQAVLLMYSHAKSFKGPVSVRKNHWRSFNAPMLADRILPSATTTLGRPLHVVIGPSSVAAALAVQLPEKPLVLIDGRYDRSPWVPIDLVKRCGAVELIEGLGTTAPQNVQLLGAEFPGLGWRIVSPERVNGPASRCDD